MPYETLSSVPPQKPEVFSREEKEFLNAKLQDMHDGALSEDDFVRVTDSKGNTYGRYSKEEVANDKAEIALIKRGFEVKEKVRELEVADFENQQKIIETSKYLEALFYEKLGGKDGWIPNAAIYKSSEHDDYINGVDFFIEIENEYFGSAIDVTLSRQPKVIINKLKEAKGVLVDAKYYERPDAEDTPIPVVVIALDYDHAVQALKLWADGEESLLSRHPTRVKAWLEAAAQFEASSIWLQSEGRNASAYERAYAVMQKIIDENRESVDRYLPLIEQDQAYQTIISFCDDVKAEAAKNMVG